MKSAIRIEMDYPSEKLDPLSRMNYAKLYTVEHNVKVFFIGRIAKKYERDLMVAYNEVHPPYTIDPQGYIPGSSENLASHTEQDDPGYDPNYRQEEGGPSTYPAYDDGYAGD